MQQENPNVSTGVFLGIDAGSVTTKAVALAPDATLLAAAYVPAAGAPVASLEAALRQLKAVLGEVPEVVMSAATGSARHLVEKAVGVDILCNEITCQAVAAVREVPDGRTIIEIGGQDSKIIFIRDGLVTDFAMNTICAAGTGSFLDHQASRLQMSIEEFSRRAAAAKSAVKISGRCTVFAESDMIHQQQSGQDRDGIIYGLCLALVRNYLGDVGRGREIAPPVIFQGGVAFNAGIVRALQEELGMKVKVPRHHEVMGAVGAALLAREKAAGQPGVSRFRGFSMVDCGDAAGNKISFSSRE